jgi:hypothetical protein
MADALLLASVGAWEGWRVTLRSGWWAALAGLVLVTIAWRSGRRSFTYVLALAVGFAGPAAGRGVDQRLGAVRRVFSCC